jgi:integrase
MMASKQLTHTNLIKNTKPGRYFDGRSALHLWIKSPSQRYWIYRFQMNKKRHDMSLGSYPRVSLAEARKKALEARLLIDAGVNPLLAKKERQAIPKKVAGPSFEAFSKDWIELKCHEWRNLKHGDQWRNTLRDYAYPIIGKISIDEINTNQILEILVPIWKSKTETAVRLRGRLEKILAGATTRGLRTGQNPAQWKGHLENILPKPTKVRKVIHHPAMHYDDLPDFIMELRTDEAISRLALELTILTCTRTSEVLLAKKDEFNGSIWTIPASRMKAGIEHRIPLGFRAQQIVNQMLTAKSNSDYLFQNNGRPLSNMALLMLLRRLRPGITVHGFRSTFRDWVAEKTTHSPEVAEKCLAHSLRSLVEAAYQRGDMVERRKILILDWEAYCYLTINQASNKLTTQM